MLEAVRNAHQSFDQWLEAHAGSKRISCSKGCAHCCHTWVVIGLAEAQYLLQHLSLQQAQAMQNEGHKRLERLKHTKDQANFVTQFFLEAHPCPLLATDQSCQAYEFRPLACRGVLTDLNPTYCRPGALLQLSPVQHQAYTAQLGPQHSPEHYLKRPWAKSESLAQRLWQQQQSSQGFTVVGEMCGLVYLLTQEDFAKALASAKETTQYLRSLGVWGGAWGYWVG